MARRYVIKRVDIGVRIGPRYVWRVLDTWWPERGYVHNCISRDLAVGHASHHNHEHGLRAAQYRRAISRVLSDEKVPNRTKLLDKLVRAVCLEREKASE